MCLYLKKETKQKLSLMCLGIKKMPHDWKRKDDPASHQQPRTPQASSDSKIENDTLT